MNIRMTWLCAFEDIVDAEGVLVLVAVPRIPTCFTFVHCHRRTEREDTSACCEYLAHILVSGPHVFPLGAINAVEGVAFLQQVRRVFEAALARQALHVLEVSEMSTQM